MKDKQLCDSSATPPEKSGSRHFFERQNDGTLKPVTFHYLEKLDTFEFEGRLYSEQLLASMVRAGVLWPASSPKAKVFSIKPAISNGKDARGSHVSV